MISKTIESESIIDYGTKKVPRANYSRLVVLDKNMLINCGCDTSPDSEIRVKVQLVKSHDANYIKLTPINGGKHASESNDSGDTKNV